MCVLVWVCVCVCVLVNVLTCVLVWVCVNILFLLLALLNVCACIFKCLLKHSNDVGLACESHDRRQL